MAIPLTLKVFQGGTLITSKDFERDIIKIGRLSSAHLRLEDEKVSRVHSVLEVSADGALSIIDMGSVEGTYVNGKRVNKGRVSFGDEIRVGETTLRLENPAAVAATNLAAAVASTEVTEPVAPVVEVAPASSLTQAVAEPVPEPVPELVAESPRPVRSARSGKKRGPLGVSLCFRWGEQRVGEFFLPPGQKRSFSVGNAAGVDFIMGDARLGRPRLEVVRTDGQTPTVFFTGKMKGELVRQGEALDVQALIESGKASHEEEAYALALQADDSFRVDLGGIHLEVSLQPAPRRVHVPWADSVDYRALNIFLLMLFAGAMFIIGATNRGGGDEAFADELNSDTTRLAKLIIKPPEPQKNPFIAKLTEKKAVEAKRTQQTQRTRDEVKQPRRDPERQVRRAPPPPVRDAQSEAKELARSLFKPGKSGASVFSSKDLGSELKSATGNIFSAVGSTGGFGSLGPKVGPGGPGGVGGTGDSVRIGGVGTVGRSSGNVSYGNNVGALTGKQIVDVGITSSEPVVNTGSLDKELVRRVIQDNRSQIRSCYERLLNQYPNLGGKVQAQFTIGPDGRVLSAKVTQSSANNEQLETCVASRVRLWQFPKPKGGGTVMVSYPFIFKQAGQ
ncbi:TonB family protein [Hyalangium rubrum]|uniref:TonB family protein n=1 Tax=Hyalangium rubrum TaxID=3103134 RepID=A0ABU5H2K4_9BACT|nr:TonB family protein [Hyalangium sp. s54d21]MDY7227023.1 TonB family protein [Hyalangium sp. s54d21]